MSFVPHTPSLGLQLFLGLPVEFMVCSSVYHFSLFYFIIAIRISEARDPPIRGRHDPPLSHTHTHTYSPLLSLMVSVIAVIAVWSLCGYSFLLSLLQLNRMSGICLRYGYCSACSAIPSYRAFDGPVWKLGTA